MQPRRVNLRLNNTKSNFMKIPICIVFMLLVVNQSFSQKSDRALSGSYTTDELATIKNEDPTNIDVLMFGLKNATYIIDFPKEKEVEINQEILIPQGKFNYIDLGFKILNVNQYFKIIGTDKVLVIKSMWVLRNEFNTSKK